MFMSHYSFFVEPILEHIYTTCTQHHRWSSLFKASTTFWLKKCLRQFT